MKSPNDQVPAQQLVNAPREIMRLINWLMTYVTDPVRAIKIMTACPNGALE